MLAILFRIYKQAGRTLKIFGAFRFFLDFFSIRWVFVDKRHISKRLSAIGKRRSSWYWPPLAAVLFAQLESLPHKIAGCQPKCQRYIREIGRRHQRFHSHRAHSHNTDFSVPVSHQPLDCRFDSFKRTINVAVIVLPPRNAEHIDTVFVQSFCTAFCHIIVWIVSEKTDHCAVRPARILIIRAIKAVTFCFKKIIFSLSSHFIKFQFIKIIAFFNANGVLTLLFYAE